MMTLGGESDPPLMILIQDKVRKQSAVIFHRLDHRWRAGGSPGQVLQMGPVMPVIEENPAPEDGPTTARAKRPVMCETGGRDQDKDNTGHHNFNCPTDQYWPLTSPVLYAISPGMSTYLYSARCNQPSVAYLSLPLAYPLLAQCCVLT